MEQISDAFKAKNLFLLVGTNPLPVYIAIRLLKPEQGHVYLICTALTREIAENICRIVGLKINTDATLISVKEAYGSEIEHAVGKAAANKDDIGFNYTGGTKYMVLHTHEALKKAAGSAPLTYSYLDAQTLSMQLEKHGVNSISPSIRLALQVSLEDLLGMHGLITPNFSNQPICPDIYPDLIRVPYDSLKDWYAKFLANNGGNKRPHVQLPIGHPFQDIMRHWQGATTLGELSTIWQQCTSDLADWFKSNWLEDYTLWSLQKIDPKKSYIHQTGMNLILGEPAFEFDVVAMRGYQLFAFSCTQSSSKGTVKLKLMESYIRARQMGGDEARVAVVCRSPSPQQNPKNNPQLIEQEIASGDNQKQVRVFGEEHLPDLSYHLLKWFNEQ